jgi:hypothetical protein
VEPELQQVGVERRAGEHADPSGMASRVVPGGFQRLVGELEQDPVLRVHAPGFERREPEEPGIEVARLIEDRRRPDIPRLAQVGGGHAGRQELVLRKAGDRFDPVGEVAPERVEGAGPREPSGHPHDGDIEVAGRRAHAGLAWTGSGSARRSVLPLAVTGIRSIRSKRCGIM